MGNTYFCFSDESGDFYTDMSDKSIKRHPYYIRSSLIINSQEWSILNSEMLKLKELYSFKSTDEIKWSYLHSIKIAETNGAKNSKKNKFDFFDCSFKKCLEFVEESLDLLNKLEYKTIVLSFTDNITYRKWRAENILKQHLRAHMQRVEMGIQGKDDHLAVLFCDPICEDKNKMLQDEYYYFYNKDRFINKYKPIKDSLNFENSHQSVGIQLADLIAGSFNSFLKSDNNNYNDGKNIFKKYVFPHLREINGQIIGMGIVDIPKNEGYRKCIQEKLEELNSYE